MANLRAEFHDDEQALMWETFAMLEALLDPKSLKPPQKHPVSGKWHFYIESADHKKKSKRNIERP